MRLRASAATVSSRCGLETEAAFSREPKPKSPSSKSKTTDPAFARKSRGDCSIRFSAPGREGPAWVCRSRRGLSIAMEGGWISKLTRARGRSFASCFRLMKKSKDGASILLIEDDPVVAESLKRLLTEHYQVETAATAEEGLVRAESRDFAVVLTDLQMRGISGLDFIKALHPARPHLPIVLMTAHHTTDTAIEATKAGAFDYVLKPIIDLEGFFKVIENAVATRALTTKPVAMGEDRIAHDAIIGRSRAMQNVYKEIGWVAARPVTVFVRGETGTGKELVVRALYQHSDRVNRPFIIVNCVAIPETLLESELFGHEQGAFTGAQTRRIGKFEQANQGTIFLDEIGDMSLATQAKLLRVLQEKTIQRVGGKETFSVDVRVIAATHRDLEQAVREQTFREDLYYRLNDAVIRVPALRERREDIPALVDYFLHQQGAGPAAAKPGITDEALRDRR